LQADVEDAPLIDRGAERPGCRVVDAIGKEWPVEKSAGAIGKRD